VLEAVGSKIGRVVRVGVWDPLPPKSSLVDDAPCVFVGLDLLMLIYAG
jgi:hypothetical protein